MPLAGGWTDLLGSGLTWKYLCLLPVSSTLWSGPALYHGVNAVCVFVHKMVPNGRVASLKGDYDSPFHELGSGR